MMMTRVLFTTYLAAILRKSSLILNAASSTLLVVEQFHDDEEDFLINPSILAPLSSARSRSMPKWPMSLILDSVDFLALEGELEHFGSLLHHGRISPGLMICPLT